MTLKRGVMMAEWRRLLVTFSQLTSVELQGQDKAPWMVAALAKHNPTQLRHLALRANWSQPARDELSPKVGSVGTYPIHVSALTNNTTQYGIAGSAIILCLFRSAFILE